MTAIVYLSENAKLSDGTYSSAFPYDKACYSCYSYTTLSTFEGTMRGILFWAKFVSL